MTDAPPVSGCYPTDSTTVPPARPDSDFGSFANPATIVGSGNVLGDHSDATYAELNTYETPVFAFPRFGSVFGIFDGLPVSGDATPQVRLQLVNHQWTNQIVVQAFYTDSFSLINSWDFYVKDTLETLTEGVITWINPAASPVAIEAGRPIQMRATAFGNSGIGNTPRTLANIYEMQFCVGGVVPVEEVWFASPIRQRQRADGLGLSSASRTSQLRTKQGSLRGGPNGVD